MVNRRGETVVPNPKVVEAVKRILQEVNALGRGDEVAAAIYETVARDHRTIQQSFWSAVLKAQMEYASEGFDPRNEAAVKLANRVKETAKANNFDFGLPLI